MLVRTVLLSVLSVAFYHTVATAQDANYVSNRAPLRQNPYLELPLGAIRPAGWLKEVLVRQKNGATGKLDELYPLVMGNRNGWLGGDGDQWERGPYWIDGLLPLAYILDDKKMIAKVKPWIEWSIKSQQPDGYFGPAVDYPYEPGIQRDNSRDWWPKMVMLKIMKQYHEATGDKRVIKLLTNYFRYQLKELPLNPLDRWTFWSRFRAADNLAVVYWLYNRTGDAFLLELADLLHKQSFDFTNAFLNTDYLSRSNSVHAVNLAQGMKEPAVYYQHHSDQKYLDALTKGFADLRKFNGMAHGLFGGDEMLHGNNPTQGSELCTAVEMMFTLENVLQVTGGVDYADHLERIAYNALPTQITDDFMDRQYYQQANQVMISRHGRNFEINHDGTDLCYGLLTGYACCTSNMHQGWPKFVQNLWYATPDRGVAALLYAPSEVDMKVGKDKQVHISEETEYPFRNTVRFTLSMRKKTEFPFHLRIPKWCKQATIRINGVPFKTTPGDHIEIINREWTDGDRVDLTFPMDIRKGVWYENSVSIERGPLVYALKIGEKATRVVNDRFPVNYGASFIEVTPTTPWNFGLIAGPDSTLNQRYLVEEKVTGSTYPWSAASAPVLIRAKARRVPSWQLYNEMAGPMPFSVIFNENVVKEPVEDILLIPYGCTRLRISQFPVIGR